MIHSNNIPVPRIQEKQKLKDKNKKVKQKKEKSKMAKIEDGGGTDISQEKSSETEKQPIKLEVGKPSSSFHIEYFLTSELDKFNIDINYWEYAAKVYADNQEKVLRTVVRNEFTWVAFSICHSRADLTVKDLEKLYDFVSVFSISDSSKQLGTKAKADNPKAFYYQIHHEDFDSEKIIFEELYSNEDNVHLSESVSTVRKIVEEDMIEMLGTEGSTLWACPFKQHSNHVKKTITNFNPEEKLLDFRIEPEKEAVQETPKEKKKKGLNARKATKKTAGPVGHLFKLEAKLYFSDEGLLLGQVKPLVPGLTYGAALVTVRGLMTEEQAQILNPFIIRLLDVRNLPFEVLLANRVSKIFFKYQILRNKYESLKYPVQKNIFINETLTIMTNAFNPVQFIQFLQSDTFTVEMHGVLDPQEKIKPSVFGQEIYDSHISRRLTSMSPEVHCLSMLEEFPSVLLATATYRFIRMTMGFQSYEISCILQVPNRNTILYEQEGNHPNIETKIKNKTENPFTNSLLLDYSTCLNIKVKTTCPLQNIVSKVHAKLDTLNRIFMVVYDHDKAKEVITKIYEINQALLGPTIIAPDIAKRKAENHNVNLAQDLKTLLNLPGNYQRSLEIQEMLTAEAKVKSKEDAKTSKPEEASKDTAGFGSPSYAKKALTGFIIDAFDKIIIFIEGQMNGALQHVWNSVMTLPRSMGCLLYNSEIVFSSRLYPEFIPYGGFHNIILRAPLEMYFTNPKTFLEGNIPGSSWKALLNLDLLLKTSSMKCANKLFPSAESLLELDREFGVPLYQEDPELLAPFHLENQFAEVGKKEQEHSESDNE